MQKNSKGFVYLGIFFFFVFLHSYLNYGQFAPDDFSFRHFIQPFNLISWLSYRYISWSGRLSVEAIMFFGFQFDIWFWRIANPLALILLISTINKIAFAPAQRDAGKILLTTLMVGIIPSLILFDTVLGVTQSYNYLWPTALGLYAILPIWEKAIHAGSSKPNISHFTAGLITALGQEQIAIFIVTLLFVLLILEKKNGKPFNKFFAAQALIYLISTITIFLAPGNTLRLALSETLCFPGFANFSLIDKFAVGTEYLFISMIDLNSILIFLLISALGFRTIQRSKNNKLRTIALAFLFIGFVVLLLSFDKVRGVQIKEYLMKFTLLVDHNPESGLLSYLFSKKTILSMTLWGSILLIGIPLAIYSGLDDSKAALIYLLAYLGGIATLVIMFFTPTIYCSGDRSRFFFSVMLVIQILVFSQGLFERVRIPNMISRGLLGIALVIVWISFMPVFQSYYLSEKLPFQESFENKNLSCEIQSVDTSNQNLTKIIGRIELNEFTTNTQVLLRSDKNVYRFTAKELKPGVFQAGIDNFSVPKGVYEILFLQSNKSYCSTMQTIEIK